MSVCVQNSAWKYNMLHVYSQKETPKLIVGYLVGNSIAFSMGQLGN